MKFSKTALILILCCICSSLSFAEEIDSATAYKLKLDYAKFKKIEGFGFVRVFLGRNSSKLGLSENKLTDYAKLKFKNNFAEIKIFTSDKFAELCAEERSKTNTKKTLSDHFYCSSERIGYIEFNIFSAGIDYPIAYYVSCKSGYLKHYPILEGGIECCPITWEKAHLFIDSKKNAQDRIKRIINYQIENLAIEFFKVRGNL